MKFLCFHCQQKIETDDSSAGMTVACPACGEALVVPSSVAAPKPAAAALAQSRVPRPRKGPAHPVRRSKSGGLGQLVLPLLIVGIGVAAYLKWDQLEPHIARLLKENGLEIKPSARPEKKEAAPAEQDGAGRPTETPPGLTPSNEAPVLATEEGEGDFLSSSEPPAPADFSTPDTPAVEGTGDALDLVEFGNEASEAAHGFVSTGSRIASQEWLIVGGGSIGGGVGGGKMNGGQEGDHFFFRAQKLEGDGFIQARLVSGGGSDRQMKSGLMMREKLEPTSKVVFALDNRWDQFGPSVMTRMEEAGAASIKQFEVTTRPFWMRIQRKGDTFTTRVSENGKDWREVSTDTVSMARTVYMGYTTVPQKQDGLNEAVFDQIVTSAPQSTWGTGNVGTLELAGRSEMLGMGELSRKLLPLDPPSYYGGEITVRMKVDPAAQNYCTVKLWGSESNGNRIALTCEGKEVGSRHGGSLDIFVHSVGAVSPGAFWYRTAPLPRWLTEGKTSVELKLRGLGFLYAYGKIWNYDTYQKKMETANRSLYRLYTHTNPLLTPAAEKQGATPDYTKAPIRNTTTEEEGLARVKKGVNDRIAKIMGNKNTLSRSDYDYLADCYEVSWCDAYRKPEVVAHLVQSLDKSAAECLTKNPGGGGEWGGGYGPQGLAVFRIYKEIQPQLNEKIDLGTGMKPRRELWAAMLKASRDSGRFARRTITNQMIIADWNVYKANLGLLALRSPDAFPEKVARRYIREAVGVEEWRGNDLPDGGHEYNFGRNVYMVTAKGTTHEWNWCCHNCYGRMSPYVFEFARVTGDPEIRDKAVVMERAHAALLYPSTDYSGFRGLLNEGVICCRNVYHPGHVAYSYVNVASSLRDPLLVAGVRQQVKDGQMWDNWFDAAIQPHLPDDYAKVKAAFSKIPANSVLPMTPGQPNYAWADEQNAILSIKYGHDIHFLTFYRRWSAITRIGDAHTITPKNERVIQFQLDDVRYVDAGEYQKVGPEVQTPFTGTPPDKPENAYAGQLLPKARQENGRATALPDFYGVRYGDFLIGMNCTYKKSFPFSPPGFKEGKDMLSGKMMTAPVTVPPQSTVIFYSPLPPGPLEPDYAINPVPTDSATHVPASGLKLSWHALPGATSHRVYFGTTAELTQAHFKGEQKEPTFDPGVLEPGRIYFWRVDEVNAAGVKKGVVWKFKTFASSTPGWSSGDIGEAKEAGDYKKDGGSVTVTGSGTDIGAKADGFHYVQTSFSGNGEVIARVESLDAEAGNAKAGIMIRDSSAPGSPHVALFVTKNDGLQFVRRSTPDGDSARNGAGGKDVNAPCWLRLTRDDSLITASYSQDGLIWKEAGSATISFAGKSTAGLAVTGTGNRSATAKFSDFVAEFSGSSR